MPLGESFTVKTGTHSFVFATSNQRKMARASNGDLYCVYYRTDGVNDEIYIARSQDEGETWTEAVLTAESYNQRSPSIVIDSTDTIHVVWQGKTATRTTFYQLRYIAGTWSSWGTVQELTDVDYNQYQPCMVVDSQNRLHVVWRGNHSGQPTYRQARYIKYDAGWSGITNLTDDANHNQDMTIAVDSNDYLHVAWIAVNILKYRKYTTSWQDTVSLVTETGSQYEPSIVVDVNNDVHITWAGTSAAQPSINQIRYIKTISGVWQSVVELTDDGTYSQSESNIAIDGGGVIHVVWSATHAGSPTYDQIRYIFNDGSWSEIIDLTEDVAESQVYPNQIWANYPVIGGAKTNQPATGFAFVWVDGTTVKYFRSFDLTWDIPVPGPSMRRHLIRSFRVGSYTTGKSVSKKRVTL